PVYEARTIIQLSNKDNAKQILNVNQFYEDNTILAEIELMKSKLLVTRVVKQLPLNISYFEKGKVLTDQRYPTSSFVVELIAIRDSSIMDTPIFVHFNKDNTFQLKVGERNLGEQERVGKTVSNKYFDFKLLVIDANHYRRVENGEIEFYFKLNRPGTLASSYIRQMGIKILNSTAQTIEISLKDNNPGIARDFVMAHANEYILFDLENREKSAKSILKFIDSQLDTVYQNLRDSELQLNVYKKENKISNLDNLATLYFDYFRQFEDEVVLVDLETNMLQQVLKAIEEGKDDGMNVYSIIPLLTGTKYETSIATMLDKLRQLLVQREEIQYDLKETSSRVQSLDYSINIQRNLIVESIKSALDKLNIRKEFLESKIAEYEANFGTL